MPNTNKKITINVTTGTKDKSQLDGCYFQQEAAPATTYAFFSKNNVSLQTGITSGTAFTFSFPDSLTITWTITATIVANTSASGNWSNNDPTLEADEPESGTFTAQATADPSEEEAASPAYA
jgi:hypothetical protein